MTSDGATLAKVRAGELLMRLPEGRVWGAEIGVFSGRMSKALLDRPDLALLMVDSWEGDGAAYLEPADDWHARLTQDQQDRYMQAALQNTAQAGWRRIVMRQRSVDAARRVSDGVLDFVFLDADHSQAGCAASIATWWPKVKPNGLISGHDYANPLFPGVSPAVDEFVASHGLHLALGADTTWFTTKPNAEV